MHRRRLALCAALLALWTYGCAGALGPGEELDGSQQSALEADTPGDVSRCTVRYTGRFDGDDFIVEDTIEEGCSGDQTCRIDYCTHAVPPVCGGVCVAGEQHLGRAGKASTQLSQPMQVMQQML